MRVLNKTICSKWGLSKRLKLQSGIVQKHSRNILEVTQCRLSPSVVLLGTKIPSVSQIAGSAGAASSRHRTSNQYKRHLKASLKTCFNKVSFSNRSFFKQIHNVETQDSHWFKLVQQTFLHQLSFLSLPLREKLLNWELFGWAVGYRKLRTELQRGDRGRVWLWRRGSGRGPAVSFGPLLLGYLCALSLETVRTWTEETHRGCARPQRPK